MSESKTRDLAPVRPLTEQIETMTLHPLAAFSAKTRGRVQPMTPCLIRTDYQRDRDRILHCKAFRRLNHKTQVFIAPVDDHYRTRLTHTLEVSQVARTIARALRLNEDLTETIALGHDLGHPPFGHSGEAILHDLFKHTPTLGFHHQDHGVRILAEIERLNLTREVLDGIAPGPHLTLEAQVVEIADRMAYLHHDVEDALRAGLMHEEELPSEVTKLLGIDRQTRLDVMIMDLVQSSQKLLDDALKDARIKPRIVMSTDIEKAMMGLRKWMFKHVYLRQENIPQRTKVQRVLTGLVDYFMENPEQISPNSTCLDRKQPVDRKVLDYVAGMTDRFAIECYKKLLLPLEYSHTPFEEAFELWR